VDANAIDRDLSVQDVLLVDLNHHEFAEVHQGAKLNRHAPANPHDDADYLDL
jgi:hypothetical protein